MENFTMVVPEIEKTPEQVNVSLDVVWQGESGKYDARIAEISMVGCFIDSMGQEVMGETISLNVHLQSGIWVALLGTVIYQEYPIGFELRFNDLTDENRRLVAEVVAAHGGREAQEFLLDLTAPPSRAPVAQRRVLVAEDDPMTLQILKSIIEAQGHEVVCVADGHEAFNVLQADANFDAAIFDMMMPHLDGMGLIRYTKGEGRLSHIPVGMITAETDPKIWNDSIAAGARVFLPKPFTPPQIQMVLNMLFDSAGPQ